MIPLVPSVTGRAAPHYGGRDMQQLHGNHMVVERFFSAPVDEVFAAWRAPDAKAAWFAPGGAVYRPSGARIEAGSHETILERFGAGFFVHEIRYSEVTENSLIAYRCDSYLQGWRVASAVVTVHFLASPAGTRLRIDQHTAVASGVRQRQGHKMPSKPFVAPEERFAAATGRRAPF